MRLALSKDFTITAAAASAISDGASALVPMRESEAEKRGPKPLARVVVHSAQSQHPSEFTDVPVETLFAKAGLSEDDVDPYEIKRRCCGPVYRLR